MNYFRNGCGAGEFIPRLSLFNVLKIFPFVQIMALNMFSIEETKLRSGSSSATTPTTYRSVAQVPVISCG